MEVSSFTFQFLLLVVVGILKGYSVRIVVRVAGRTMGNEKVSSLPRICGIEEPHSLHLLVLS
jgi:hypothetical protein